MLVLIMKKWILIFFFCSLIVGCSKDTGYVKVPDFSNQKREDILQMKEQNEWNITVEEEYDSEKEQGIVIKQEPLAGSLIRKNEEIIVTISKGKAPNYQELGVNELGKVPIMMYHGIQNKQNYETNYIGGNIDVDGYQRTKEAFEKDLDFYYQEGYRMIRLIDFINGKIEVEIGKSPIVLTFDDGKNNINVIGIDENGELVIDPNCAVGILESWKQKYPDYRVTATFFLNGNLFEDDKYNEKILKWLVEHGYDIGNHGYNHADFSKITEEQSSVEIGKLYALLDTMIPKQYVPIVALPFGSPYSKEHPNFSSILNSSYNGKEYSTISTLRVGWEANVSCFDQTFDSSFLKRIRAYDHNGSEFDIEMNFNLLKESRFISDGDAKTITVPQGLEKEIGKTGLKIHTY